MAAEQLEKEYRSALCALYVGDGRCRVESEVLLPDYKEEAYRIVRVDPKIRIQSRNQYLQGQNFVCELEGVATLNLIYQTDRKSERGRISSFVTQESFSYTFRFPVTDDTIDPESIHPLASATVENMSYQLLGPRKVSVRCEIALLLDVKCAKEYGFYSRLFPEDLFTKGREMTVVRPVTTLREEYSFSETLTLPKAYLEIGEVCDVDVALFAEKARAEDGGIQFQASACLSCTYVSAGEESVVSFYQPIEFSKSVAAALAEKNDAVEITLIPDYIKAEQDVDENGEKKKLLFEIGYHLLGSVYRNESIFVLQDAFSTKTELSCHSESFAAESLVSICDVNQTVNGKIAVKDRRFVRAEGIRSGVEIRNSYWDGSRVMGEGRLNLSFLGITEEGEVVSAETYYDFTCELIREGEIRIPAEEKCRIDICAGVKGTEILPEGEELLIRFDLCATVSVFSVCEQTILSEIVRGEEKKPCEPGFLYVYPNGKDSVWDFCKRYSIAPAVFLEENGLSESDPLPKAVRIRR